MHRPPIEGSSPADSPAAPLVTVHPTAGAGATAVAMEIADLIEASERPVLGLATGGTMVEVYAALVAQVRARDLDVTALTTFNLDEYMGLDADSPRTFARFMAHHLFEPLGMREDQSWFPDAWLAASDPHRASREFEGRIEASGGIDIQLLGLGRNGHVAFNEPGSSFHSRTRVVELNRVTRSDAAFAFGGLDAVPDRAITMGIATILEAKALRVLAFGEKKAEVVQATLHGEETSELPCTSLRSRHRDVQVHLDSAAASLLDPL